MWRTNKWNNIALTSQAYHQQRDQIFIITALSNTQKKSSKRETYSSIKSQIFPVNMSQCTRTSTILAHYGTNGQTLTSQHTRAYRMCCIILKLNQWTANMHYADGLAQDCSNSSVLAMELLQSCTKPSMWIMVFFIWKEQIQFIALRKQTN